MESRAAQISGSDRAVAAGTDKVPLRHLARLTFTSLLLTFIAARVLVILIMLRRIPDLFFHLGGTQIMGILLTMDAEQGVEAVRIINPREAIPIHYNDYGVFKSPLEDFQQAVEAAGLADRMRYLSHGETYRFEVPAGRTAAA